MLEFQGGLLQLLAVTEPRSPPQLICLISQLRVEYELKMDKIRGHESWCYADKAERP